MAPAPRQGPCGLDGSIGQKPAGAVVTSEQQRRGMLLRIACERIDRTRTAALAVGNFSDKGQIIESPCLERFVPTGGPQEGTIACHAVNRAFVRWYGEDFLTCRGPRANASVSSR